MNNYNNLTHKFTNSKYIDLVNDIFYPKPKTKRKKDKISKYINDHLYWKYYYNPKLSNQINFDIRKYYIENYETIKLKHKPKFKRFKRKNKKQKLQSIYDELNKQQNLNLQIID